MSDTVINIGGIDIVKHKINKVLYFLVKKSDFCVVVTSIHFVPNEGTHRFLQLRTYCEDT